MVGKLQVAPKGSTLNREFVGYVDTPPTLLGSLLEIRWIDTPQKMGTIWYSSPMFNLDDIL